jgi:hypothetical protein
VILTLCTLQSPWKVHNVKINSKNQAKGGKPPKAFR